MKIFCSQKDLDNALNIVNKAISPNNTLPVLNNILLKAEGKKLHFSATNLEIAISCSIEADVRAEGSLTVPAKLITSYVSFLSDEKVELKIEGSNDLSVNASSSDTKIKGISADEFPLIPKVDKDQEFKVKINDFYKGVTETVFSASLNTSRPVLSGVYVKVEKDSLLMVATDSYRLSEKRIPCAKSGGEDFDCIVPAKTMMELSKIVNKSTDKEMEIIASKNQALFKIGNIELVTRLIDGKYPDYKKIIPESFKTKFEVTVEDLSIVLKRVSLFAKENNNSVKILVSKDGKLLVSSDETKVGREKANLMVKIDGEDNEIMLNSQYLLDVLTYVHDDKISFEMNDKVSPALIRPLKEDDYLYIIMPLKA